MHLVRGAVVAQVRLSLTCARWNGSAVLVRWRALLDPLAENDPDLLAAKSVEPASPLTRLFPLPS